MRQRDEEQEAGGIKGTASVFRKQGHRSLLSLTGPPVIKSRRAAARHQRCLKNMFRRDEPRHERKRRCTALRQSAFHSVPAPALSGLGQRRKSGHGRTVRQQTYQSLKTVYPAARSDSVACRHEKMPGTPCWEYRASEVQGRVNQRRWARRSAPSRGERSAGAMSNTVLAPVSPFWDSL